MKYDLKKDADFKGKKKPELLERPERKSLFMDGKGNPNDEPFSEDIQGMYAAAYFIKMAYKKSHKDSELSDYVMPPLQGYWTISDEAIQRGTWTKDDFVYRLELVIPNDVPDDFIHEKLAEAKVAKQDVATISKVYAGTIEAQKVCHILHVGAYDEEQPTFDKAEAYLDQEAMQRIDDNHREIYLSDARRVEPAKLKTILEVAVKSK